MLFRRRRAEADAGEAGAAKVDPASRPTDGGDAQSVSPAAVPADPGGGSAASGVAESPPAGLSIFEPDGGARAPAGPSADLAAGLQKSRGGFIARLHGLLGGEPGGPSWDDVEETLIGGDVGAGLAMEVVERAKRRHDP